MMAYRRILALVAMDRDDIPVLRRALQFSLWTGAPLLVAYVLDYQSGFECDQLPVLTRDQVENSLLEAAQEKIRTTIANIGAEQPRILAIKGRPADTAPAVAREWRADLVVCGSAARYGLDRSRANRTTYHGDVLSVRAGSGAGLSSRLRAWLSPLLQG